MRLLGIQTSTARLLGPQDLITQVLGCSREEIDKYGRTCACVHVQTYIHVYHTLIYCTARYSNHSMPHNTVPCDTTTCHAFPHRTCHTMTGIVAIAIAIRCTRLLHSLPYDSIPHHNRPDHTMKRHTGGLTQNLATWSCRRPQFYSMAVLQIWDPFSRGGGWGAFESRGRPSWGLC